MSLNPDWDSLNQLNFMLAPRIGGPLNEALNALTLVDLPETTVDPQIWHDKARAAIANVLSLYLAWSALIQYKNGQKLPPSTTRPFPVQAILDWLTVQLELLPPAVAKVNLSLEGHQACIQEAILLLHSVGATQGSAVHFSIEIIENGVWFKVRFNRPKQITENVDELITQFDAHWRSQDAAFELKMARDFIALNDSKIEIKWNKDEQLGEFTFFIYKAGVDRQQVPGLPMSPDAEHARFVANITRLMIKPTDKTSQAKEEAQTAVSEGKLSLIFENIEEDDDQVTQRLVVLVEPLAVDEDDVPTVVGVTSVLSEQSLAAVVPAEGHDENGLKAEEIEKSPLTAKETVTELQATPALQDEQHKKPVESEPVVAKEAQSDQSKTPPLIISVSIPEPEPPAMLKTNSGENLDRPKEGTAS